MITDNNYYVDELYLPHAVPDASDAFLNVKDTVGRFIAKYEKDCLLKSLGRELSKDFYSNIDPEESSKIKEGSDEKWNELMNGTEYTDVDGNVKTWRGVRFELFEGDGYDQSFLANYVYFFYEKNEDTTRTNVGNVQESATNAARISKLPKVRNAWNQFVSMVQGECPKPTIIESNGFIGVDYYNGGAEVSLYEYINDRNAVDSTTYEGFNPKRWNEINALGL